MLVQEFENFLTRQIPDPEREARRTPRVTGAELAQDGKQGVSDQGVDFIDQQHQRSWVGFAPAGEQSSQGGTASPFNANATF